MNMKKSPDQFGSSLRENFIPILPAIVAAMLNLVMLIGSAILMQPNMGGSQRLTLVIFGVVGCAYIGLYYWVYTALPDRPLYAWLNAVIAGGALGLLIRFIPAEIDYLVHALLLISALSSSVIAGRAPSYAMVAIVAALHMTHHIPTGSPPITWIIHGMLYVAALIAVETVQQVKALATKQMARIEAVNEISKQIVSTLETEQLISLLDAALQNALDADSYYIGLLRNDELHMRLFYDDGEYFNNVRFNLEGTLSGWVINNQKALFLPDLRKPLKMEGINVVTIGKSKTSLSWMGIPMKGTHVNGVIAIASYRPKAFNRSDFDLLSSIAQRAALALDNTYHHAQVEEQARLDSLTRVLNHSRFIETLREQAETCLALRQPLSLIMLDIDHFKQYNDSFGHPVGDEILVNLCRIIREHIKQTDAVGRWGGEEFAVSLPNSDGQQTFQVAQRIRSTLAGFEINNNGLLPIPAPTVSMGIAVFPAETNDVTKLIDIADRRLYIAKRRGRDQIETAG
jgi:diguanylate cyclase (GGDEF)-like protein